MRRANIASVPPPVFLPTFLPFIEVVYMINKKMWPEVEIKMALVVAFAQCEAAPSECVGSCKCHLIQEELGTTARLWSPPKN